jgi:hypothetical protein
MRPSPFVMVSTQNEHAMPPILTWSFSSTVYTSPRADRRATVPDSM